MQGQRNSLSMLSENISLDHGSISSDTGIDSRTTWDAMPTSAPNGLPDFTLSSNEINIQYLRRARHDRQNTRWSFGETSSSAAQNQGNQNETETEHTWSFHSGVAPTSEQPEYRFPNILSSNNVEIDSNGNQATNGSFHLHNSSSVTFPRDLNVSSGFGDHEDEDCQIVERPNVYNSVASSNGQIPSANSSFDSYGASSGRCEYNLETSLDGRRISCKRKALEIHTGHSSGEGSSNPFQNAERSQWHSGPVAQIAASNNSMPTQTENNFVFSNASTNTNPRLRFGVEGTSSASPFSLPASGNTGGSRRNLRLRVNSLHQQDAIAPFSAEADVRNEDIIIPYDPLAGLDPVPPVENDSPHAQFVSSICRNPQTRWNGASTSRTSQPSASAISRDWEASPYGESTSRSIPRNILGHPMFVPAGEIGSSSQISGNLNSAGGHSGIVQNIPSTFGPPGSGVSSPAPSWPHQSSPQFPRRLTEIVRRSLLTFESAESGEQSSDHARRSSTPIVSEEIHTPNSSLERNLDGSRALGYSLRALAAASERRNNIMSEIRHVLNLMRRGEGLRFEMNYLRERVPSVISELAMSTIPLSLRVLTKICSFFVCPRANANDSLDDRSSLDLVGLDHPLFFGMADIHDRHRDMRLDVDNMSYEELLALEERIGDVCTGLSEETIMACLKQYDAIAQFETEPCSICQEEYEDGEKLGKLECGHNFHAACIKQWLMKKNVCPICKKTGLTQ